MNSKEQVLAHLSDARLVYNNNNKPFILSNNKLFEGKSASNENEAWDNALAKINNRTEEMVRLGVYNKICL